MASGGKGPSLIPESILDSGLGTQDCDLEPVALPPCSLSSLFVEGDRLYLMGLFLKMEDLLRLSSQYYPPVLLVKFSIPKPDIGCFCPKTSFPFAESCRKSAQTSPPGALTRACHFGGTPHPTPGSAVAC